MYVCVCVLFTLIGHLKKSKTIAIILAFNFVFRCFLYSIMWLSEWDYSKASGRLKYIRFVIGHLFFINWQLLAANTLFCFIFILLSSFFCCGKKRPARWTTQNNPCTNRAMAQSCLEGILDFIRKYAVGSIGDGRNVYFVIDVLDINFLAENNRKNWNHMNSMHRASCTVNHRTKNVHIYKICFMQAIGFLFSVVLPPIYLHNKF